MLIRWPHQKCIMNLISSLKYLVSNSAKTFKSIAARPGQVDRHFFNLCLKQLITVFNLDVKKKFFFKKYWNLNHLKDCLLEVSLKISLIKKRLHFGYQNKSNFYLRQIDSFYKGRTFKYIKNEKLNICKNENMQLHFLMIKLCRS